jgi:hypothetical protein
MAAWLGLPASSRLRWASALAGVGVLPERVLPFAPGHAKKPFHFVVRNIGQRGIGACRRVKRARSEMANAFQMLHQARVE